VCEAHGEQAAALLPRLRQQLTGLPAEPPRDRLNDPRRYVLQALPLLGAEALGAVPDLLGLLETGTSVRPALGALARFGPAALATSGSRDPAAVIRAAFAAAKSDYDRADAAAALQAVTGDDSLAWRLAAEIAARPQ
jgi:hypothetical protein